MKLDNQPIYKSLNKAFLKQKPSRQELEYFCDQIFQLCSSILDKDREQNYVYAIRDFFNRIGYKDRYSINSKDDIDLVIRYGNEPDSSVGVLIEVKSFRNTSEMISLEDVNKKSFHELLLYYLKERREDVVSEIRHVIITNLHEWYIFDARDFEAIIDKGLKRSSDRFFEGGLTINKTEQFYQEVISSYIKQSVNILPVTYIKFNAKDFAHVRLSELPPKKLNHLIQLYKVFSPEHLLQLPFANDSNTLDRGFYEELLYIMGIEEVKKEGRRLIQRPLRDKRQLASLLEDTILQLESLGKLARLEDPEQYGRDKEEQLYCVALELCITWVNRLLFLKLLEAQLLSFHSGEKKYQFVNKKVIDDYDDLNTIFFQVLAVKPSERNEEVLDRFSHLPYLNSTLFTPTELEHRTVLISNLSNDKSLRMHQGTVLKDAKGKRRKDGLRTLTYLFRFLDAYDFSSDGIGTIHEVHKPLISSAILGLIFEKINGFRDGAFYTPGYITMCLSRESIRRSVLQKFNEQKGWDCGSIVELRNKISDRISLKEANVIVNSLRVCDPAVGSGHFLVSVLNEIIFLKHELGILMDVKGRLLRHYDITLENDELIVTDPHQDGIFFNYNPISAESHRVQETLFEEKRRIIENCLFGVDINSNSVNICRLRLWIELLKHAYYNADGELETLPNIDINIRFGNSLVSRFELKDDLKDTFKDKRVSYTFQDYKGAVSDYKKVASSERKHEIVQIIEEIKNNFRSSLSKRYIDRFKKAQRLVYEQEWKIKNLKKLKLSLNQLDKNHLKELREKEKVALEKKEEVERNVVGYENAFEWRFEFPEVLDDLGGFLGFDLVIGNPPYIQIQAMGDLIKGVLERCNYRTWTKMGDIYFLFYELGLELVKEKGLLSYITSNKWLRTGSAEVLRTYLSTKNPLYLVDLGSGVFDMATVDTSLLIVENRSVDEHELKVAVQKEKELPFEDLEFTLMDSVGKDNWVVLSDIEKSIKGKIERMATPLKDWDIEINYGVKTGYNKAFIVDRAKKDNLIKKDPKSTEIIRPLLRGRDVKPFGYNFQDNYLITTFPSLSIDINEYSAVKEYLLNFGKDRLEQSGRKGSRKKTNHQWFETQDSISYLDSFYNPKIVWQEISSTPKFYYDTKNFVPEATAFFLVGQGLEYLTGYLNSKISEWYFRLIGTEIGGNYRWKKYTLLKLPIILPKYMPSEEIEALVKQIQDLNRDQKSEKIVEELKRKIDRIFYKTIGLTEVEINLIDQTIGNKIS